MTKASIGIQSNNEIKTVYCDNLDQEVLVKHYTDLQDVNNLMKWGDISSLSFEDVSYYAEDGYSSAYTRSFNSVEEMVAYYNDCFCKFCFVFESNQWNTYKLNRNGSYKLIENGVLSNA